uniref:LysM domain-containing protein n=1 Tax=Periophthalmus magnuspinnatus TaxID=409849 RepID=A0A3B4AVF1_9GOBI
MLKPHFVHNEATVFNSVDGGSKSNESKWEKRRPPGTVEFIVGPNDSLNSIALKFNITPNKLVQLNKLFSHVEISFSSTHFEGRCCI